MATATTIHHGPVVKVNEKGFGFIYIGPNTRDIFFHASALDVGLCHDDTLIEREVVFQVQESPKGLKAINVRAAD